MTIPDWAERLIYLERHLAKIRKVVNEQAEDNALWPTSVRRSIVEAYLQQELRRLHDVIEGD